MGRFAALLALCLLVQMAGCAGTRSGATRTDAQMVACTPNAGPKPPCWCDRPLRPIEVTHTDTCRDGGTILVAFTDARGCEYEVCLDGQMWCGHQFDSSVSMRSSSAVRFLVSAHEWGCPEPLCLQDLRAVWPEPPRCVYIGALHPAHEGAEVLDPDSALGTAIRNALDDWLARHVTVHQRARVDSARAGGPIRLTEDERAARRVERVARSLHERVCAQRASN